MDDKVIMDEGKYWLKIDRERIITAITKCEEAAKQLIYINSITTSIYLGVISFSDMLKIPVDSRGDYTYIFSPILFWVFSLIFAANVIVPEEIDVKDIKLDYEKSSKRKFHSLIWSYSLLIISMVLMSIIIFFYFLRVPTPPTL